LVEGKTCIVTGGAGSIGLATVRTLLAEGAKVMLVDLDAEKLARTVRELGTDNAAFVAADVTDAAQTLCGLDCRALGQDRRAVLERRQRRPVDADHGVSRRSVRQDHRHPCARLFSVVQIHHPADE
jgi:NAD(P)-dependent dehydrogenase (short-subunit alcohol dehydrogenase family)